MVRLRYARVRGAVVVVRRRPAGQRPPMSTVSKLSRRGRPPVRQWRHPLRSPSAAGALLPQHLRSAADGSTCRWRASAGVRLRPAAEPVRAGREASRPRLPPVRELMRCPAAGAPRSWSEALAFEPTVRHGVAERSRATWEGIARDRADGGPVRLLGTDERGDQPAAETTALGRPWSPVVQVTELSQVNLGASLGYQHCCVSITIGWSCPSRPPIGPRVVEPVETTVLPRVVEPVETTVLPRVVEPVETTVLPRVVEPVETTVLPRVVEPVETTVLPRVVEPVETTDLPGDAPGWSRLSRPPS